MTRAALALLLVAISACSHEDECDSYAYAEYTCGQIAGNEREVVRVIATGMCRAARSKDPKVAAVGEVFAKEAQCAMDTVRCSDYTRCVSKVESEPIASPPQLATP
ncbi:MAG TPA: hypothetical protein VLX92_12565 [Kofleriaceae bacterium]|nr:hypothetical protein [Kofleriaceae bacterium]